MAAARARLESQFGTRILISSPEVIAIADDKLKTAHFMAERGFVAPLSAQGSDNENVERIVAAVGFPLIVKPRIGARSVGVHKVRNRRELVEAIGRVESCVVQECAGDDDREYTASGLCFDGRCDAVIVMRRDLRDGNTYRAFVSLEPELDQHVRIWTEALDPLGPANFQFRVGRDGVPRVFEINARFSGTTPLRALAGFNEVEMCLRRLLWNEPIMQPAIRELTVLRHWSEIAIDPARATSVPAI